MKIYLLVYAFTIATPPGQQAVEEVHSFPMKSMAQCQAKAREISYLLPKFIHHEKGIPETMISVRTRCMDRAPTWADVPEYHSKP